MNLKNILRRTSNVFLILVSYLAINKVLEIFGYDGNISFLVTGLAYVSAVIWSLISRKTRYTTLFFISSIFFISLITKEFLVSNIITFTAGTFLIVIYPFVGLFEEERV